MITSWRVMADQSLWFSLQCSVGVNGLHFYALCLWCSSGDLTTWSVELPLLRNSITSVVHVVVISDILKADCFYMVLPFHEFVLLPGMFGQKQRSRQNICLAQTNVFVQLMQEGWAVRGWGNGVGERTLHKFCLCWYPWTSRSNQRLCWKLFRWSKIDRW